IDLEAQVGCVIEKEAQFWALAGPAPGTRLRAFGYIFDDVGGGVQVPHLNKMADRVRLGSTQRLTLHRRSVGVPDVHAAAQNTGEKQEVQPKHGHEVVSIAPGRVILFTHPDEFRPARSPSTIGSPPDARASRSRRWRSAGAPPRRRDLRQRYALV